MIKCGINDKMNKPNVHMFHCYAEPLFCNCEICQDCNQFCGVYSYRLQIVFCALLHNFKHIKTRMVMPVDITYMTSYEFLKQINRHHEQITTTAEFLYIPNVSLFQRLFCAGLFNDIPYTGVRPKTCIS